MSVDGPPSVTISALGVHVLCRPRDEATADAVRRAWVDATVEDPGPTEPAAVLTAGLDGSNDVSGQDVAEVMHQLSPAVTQRAIAAHQGELVMLHAAALADAATGATAVLVAASGTGKTTASCTLGTTFAYLSDETAAITRDGVVLPYRKPLSIIEGGPFKEQRSPSELGLLMTDRECHLAAVLVIERRPDHRGEPDVASLAAVDAIAALAPQSSYLPSMHRPLHRLAEVCEMAGGARHVTYAEASGLEAVLRELLGRAG